MAVLIGSGKVIDAKVLANNSQFRSTPIFVSDRKDITFEVITAGASVNATPQVCNDADPTTGAWVSLANAVAVGISTPYISSPFTGTYRWASILLDTGNGATVNAFVESKSIR